MATWRMKGEYLKDCSCIAFCPCDSDGDPAPHKFCEGVIGMHVREGNFEGVDLSGLTWLVGFHFPGPLYEGNGAVEVYIDERSSPEQRDALLAILGGQAGGPWFEIVSAMAPNIQGVHFVPIEWEFDKGRRRARAAVPDRVEVINEPIKIKPSGEENHIIVQIPDGVEYKEMYVSHTSTLRSTGTIRFDRQNTSGGLAEIEHTNTGLVA